MPTIVREFLVSVRIAFRAMRSHKLRSILTLLGVIIGVGAVIAMLAIGQGASRDVQRRITALGANTLMVWPHSITSAGVRLGAAAIVHDLTLDDAQAIRDECPSVLAVAPITLSFAHVIYTNQNWFTGIMGTTPDYLDVRQSQLADGRYFTDNDVQMGAKVCVLGQTVVDNLFGDADPVGATIRIRNCPFTVIGVLVPRGQSFGGSDQDDEIEAPILSVQRYINHFNWIHFLSVAATDCRCTISAQDEMADLLRRRHGIVPDGQDDFIIRNMADLTAAAQSSSRTFALLLASIASVALLVGGIGVMNIMLVSVTERTREIGIRMAFGAKGRDVLLQFLVEAVVLSLFGGALGILFGVGATALIRALTSWPISLDPGAILLAFSFSAAVGIFFGFYPARRASRMEPIDALRYE